VLSRSLGVVAAVVLQAALAAQSAVPETETQTTFPWRLVEQVFDVLEEHKVKCVRYCDLETERSWCGSRYRYLDEFVRFKLRRLGLMATARDLITIGLHGSDLAHRPPADSGRNRSGSAAPTVILQHDADALPERTLEMMRREQRRGLVSSCYFLVHPADHITYEPDLAALRRLEQCGFEVGYHQNAYERSGYDADDAYATIERDLDWMRQHFNVRSFVPHGGSPSPTGLNNAHLPHAGPLKPLLWAYNGDCILKDATWSDGGIRKNAPIDPREFVKRLAPGSRAVMLMHPQYYGDTLRADWQQLPIARSKWWRELWGL
jgi:hypothetical protein